MQGYRGPLTRAHLNLLILVICFLAGAAFDRFVSGSVFSADPGVNLHLISEAWNVIQRVYVDKAALTPGLATYGAIDGMVDSLGDTGHSRFLSPEMLRKLKQLEKNNFEGIGAEVRVKDGHLVIVAPMQDSPAQRSGLRSGDIILKVDGTAVTGMKLEQAIERISGPAGSKVTLTIMAQGSDTTREVTLTRSRITIHEVTWAQIPGIPLAHIHVANFGKGASEDLIKALHAAKKNDVRGVILDLRNNPGGLLKEAIATTSQFLASGSVLLEKNSQGQTSPIGIQPGGIAIDLPVAVLVNNGSASASEIVAGALQDANRAKIIGETTFGTGTVLSEFKLSDGSALLLAIEEWLTPKGHLIWHKGIIPDIPVPLAANIAPLFPESERSMPGIHWREIQDKQLVNAIELLYGAAANQSLAAAER